MAKEIAAAQVHAREAAMKARDVERLQSSQAWLISTFISIIARRLAKRGNGEQYEGYESSHREAAEDISTAIADALIAPEKTIVDLFEAFGAHVQADAYRDAMPDDAKDAAYLRKQETWWRLKAREWAGDAMSERAAQSANERAGKEGQQMNAQNKGQSEVL